MGAALLLADGPLCVFYCAVRDSAAVYSSVTSEDTSYAEIIIKEMQNNSKMRGTAASCLHHSSLLQPTTGPLL